MHGKITIGAVIPAAGLSSRMGSFKPLLQFGSGTVIEATVQNTLPHADAVVTVLGKRADELREILTKRFDDRLIITENPDYASTDMFRSLQIGLKALPECDAFFLIPADMPMISGSVFDALTDSFISTDEVLIPTVGGRRGHPPLISSALIPDILAYGGEGGLRGFFDNCNVREIPVDDTGALTDLDTPEDYNKAQNKISRN